MSTPSSSTLPTNRIAPETEVFIEVCLSATDTHLSCAKRSYTGINFEWVTDHRIRFFDVHAEKPVEIGSSFPIVVTLNKKCTS
jgi:hypothetical protein